MTGKIDFDTAQFKIATRPDKIRTGPTGTEFHPFVARLHFKCEDGFEEDGTKRYKWAFKSKTFDETVDTEAKARRAANKWLRQLREDQEAAEGRVREREAEEERRRREEEARRAAESSPFIPDYVDSFIEAYRGSNGAIEQSTLTTYRATAKHIRAGFEGVRLSQLSPKMIDAWLNHEGESFGRSVLSKNYRLLNLVCKYAVRDGDLDKNPCDQVAAPKNSEPKLNPLTATSRDDLVNELRRMRPTPVRTAAFIALYMGLREGEICALRWGDVDLKRREMHVQRAIGRGDGGDYEKVPKTKSSDRRLIIPESLIKPLTERRARMRSELNALGIKKTPDEFARHYVIGDVNGRFLSPATIGRQWSVLADNLGFFGTQGRPCTFHDLRHSFATAAIAAGVDVKTVQSSLGHSSAATTLNVYASADEQAKRQAAKIMDDALEPSMGKVIEFGNGTDGR